MLKDLVRFSSNCPRCLHSRKGEDDGEDGDGKGATPAEILVELDAVVVVMTIMTINLRIIYWRYL